MNAIKVLNFDTAGVAEAAAILTAGGRVAFPTETVFGLGADARQGPAVASIFEAKSRPAFNPLIVHVADIEAAQGYAEWTPEADRLARAFWPGPLTLVLPLRAGHGLSDLVTAGLPSVGIRVPAHPAAQALLRAFGGPIAAPSANPSGKISPTTTAHVITGLGDRIEAVLDGGACEVGLESTIIGFAPTPVLLRAGGVPREDIDAVLGTPLTDHTAPEAKGITAPGQMASHYAPSLPVRLNASSAKPGELMLGFGAMACDINLSDTGELREAAANLFRHLHALDALAKTTSPAPTGIAVAPIPAGGLGAAINDRLRRAAAPRP
ncbi:threonylcarbamoyl-AMP synthase [Rhodobacterales bacterium 59_46_T64]|nr:threonylcarbamoyl-AMP synthase [Rhodobacterales bacterium 59_46_T64]